MRSAPSQPRRPNKAPARSGIAPRRVFLRGRFPFPSTSACGGGEEKKAGQFARNETAGPRRDHGTPSSAANDENAENGGEKKRSKKCLLTSSRQRRRRRWWWWWRPRLLAMNRDRSWCETRRCTQVGPFAPKVSSCGGERGGGENTGALPSLDVRGLFVSRTVGRAGLQTTREVVRGRSRELARRFLSQREVQRAGGRRFRPATRRVSARGKSTGDKSTAIGDSRRAPTARRARTHRPTHGRVLLSAPLLHASPRPVAAKCHWHGGVRRDRNSRNVDTRDAKQHPHRPVVPSRLSSTSTAAARAPDSAPARHEVVRRSTSAPLAPPVDPARSSVPLRWISSIPERWPQISARAIILPRNARTLATRYNSRYDPDRPGMWNDRDTKVVEISFANSGTRLWKM